MHDPSQKLFCHDMHMMNPFYAEINIHFNITGAMMGFLGKEQILKPKFGKKNTFGISNKLEL